MRKSRIYLGLGVLSLMAAFVIAELPRVCGHARSIGNCRAHRTIKSHVPSYHIMYGHAIAGRFDQAVDCARQRLAADPRDAESRLYLAYSLRGRGDLAQAESDYTAALEQANAQGEIANWIAIDALTGRAACRLAIDSAAAAEADLLAAKDLALAEEAMLENPRTAYQLACIYAQFSSVYTSLAMRGSEKATRNMAMGYLQQARERGYDNDYHVLNDLDLQPIHAGRELTAQTR